MFTLDATPVKFVVLLMLFAWCTLWCSYELTRRQDRAQRVSTIAHLAMAVVMLLMVAGPTWTALTAVVPTTVLVGVFGVATAWFVGLAAAGFRAADRRAGWHFSGHAAMFAAMTWHLAAMAVKAGHGGHGHGGHQHGAVGQPVETAPWLFALVGLPLMAYLLAAAVAAARNLTRRPAVADADWPAPVGAVAPATLRPAPPVRGCHEDRAVGSLRYRLGALNDFAMNFGMFWMSTGLLVPILPFFAAFAF
ncbi:MAG: DUF5134 domain-containing protein [Actinomycetota bacterium]|nr:DUF5134 domain-containing protein [Actinomycetota bacterium]